MACGDSNYISVAQGDSSDTMLVQMVENGSLATDLTAYTGMMYLVTKIGTTPILTKPMDKTSDFRVQLSPVDTIGLAAGNYIAILQIINTTLNYTGDTQVPIMITPKSFTA